MTRATINVAPAMREARRIAGTKEILPDAATREQIIASGKTRLAYTAKAGAVEDVAMLKSSGFVDYDATVVATIPSWRFKAYAANAHAIDACTAVTFIYAP